MIKRSRWRCFLGKGLNLAGVEELQGRGGSGRQTTLRADLEDNHAQADRDSKLIGASDVFFMTFSPGRNNPRTFYILQQQE
jgi:hypothetical protein